MMRGPLHLSTSDATVFVFLEILFLVYCSLCIALLYRVERFDLDEVERGSHLSQVGNVHASAPRSYNGPGRGVALPLSVWRHG